MPTSIFKLDKALDHLRTLSPGIIVIFRIRPLILITAVATSLILISIGCTCAQENPFDSGSGSESTPSRPVKVLEEPEIGSDTPQTASLLIRSVKQSNPESPIELARAIKVMLNVRQFDFAKYYLSRLMSASMEENQQAELVSELGSDFFFTLHATEELAPEGREFSRKMLAANRQVQQSPEQIQGLVAKLNDPSIAIRSRAFRGLRRIGPTAIAALIEVFSDQDSKAVFPGVRGALRSMGEQAIPLLRGAAVADHAGVRSESLQALAHYRGEGVADVLASAVLSTTENVQVRNAVAYAMRDQKYRLPASSDLVLRLKNRADSLLAGKETVRGSLASTMQVWQWDSETSKLKPVKVTLATASRYEAARLAREAYAIEPQSTTLRQLYLLTQLEVAKRSVGTQGESNVVKGKEFFRDLPSSVGTVSPQELNELLKLAVEKKAVPAAIACCELLAESGGTHVFHSAGSQMPPIVQSIMLGDRHLQFAALNVIDKLDPATAYPGSSLAVKLAVFLADTHQRSVGLVGHHRLGVAQTIAGSLPSAGLFGASASTSRSCFDFATRDPDVRLVLISDTLVAPRFDELIRQLRADFRTARTPIGLMLRGGSQNQAVARMIAKDPLTYAFPVAIDGELLATHVRRASSLGDADLSLVTDGDRYRHAEASAKWLAKISSDRQRFGFYELGSFQQQLAGLLYRPGLEDAASQILANLGTPLAQRELANFASQKTVPPQRRRIAADSLSRSIEAGSTLLTRGQIKQQYDRYNASEQESEDARDILGSILDAIEQRRFKSR